MQIKLFIMQKECQLADAGIGSVVILVESEIPIINGQLLFEFMLGIEP